MDITHDNVCSSMLSCFYSHLLSTGRPISSFTLNADNIAWKLLKMALEVEYMMEYQHPVC